MQLGEVLAEGTELAKSLRIGAWYVGGAKKKSLGNQRRELLGNHGELRWGRACRDSKAWHRV